MGHRVRPEQHCRDNILRDSSLVCPVEAATTSTVQDVRVLPSVEVQGVVVVYGI